MLPRILWQRRNGEGQKLLQILPVHTWYVPYINTLYDTAPTELPKKLINGVLSNSAHQFVRLHEEGPLHGTDGRERPAGAAHALRRRGQTQRQRGAWSRQRFERQSRDTTLRREQEPKRLVRPLKRRQQRGAGTLQSYDYRPTTRSWLETKRLALNNERRGTVDYCRGKQMLQ